MAIYNTNNKNIQKFAKQLRSGQTDAERKLWHKLRSKQVGVKFRRQMPIGEYIVDFCSLEAKLVIELDGSQHIDTEKNILYDEKRTKYLNERGFKVLRYFNNEVLFSIENVLDEIWNSIENKI